MPEAWRTIQVVRASPDADEMHNFWLQITASFAAKVMRAGLQVSWL